MSTVFSRANFNGTDGTDASTFGLIYVNGAHLIVDSNHLKADGGAANYTVATPGDNQQTVTAVFTGATTDAPAIYLRTSSDFNTGYFFYHPAGQHVWVLYSVKGAGNYAPIGSPIAVDTADGTDLTVSASVYEDTGTTKISVSVTRSDGPSDSNTFTDASSPITQVGKVYVSIPDSPMTLKSLVVTDGVVVPPPVAPTDLTVTDTTADSVSLQLEDNDADADGYTYQYDVDSTFTAPVSIDVPDGETTTATIPLNAGVTYYIRVRAYNDGGNSDWSNTVSVTVEEEGGSGGSGTVSGSTPSFVGIKLAGSPIENAFSSTTTDLTALSVRVYVNGTRDSNGSHLTLTTATHQLDYSYTGTTVAGDSVLVGLYDADGAFVYGHRYSVWSATASESGTPRNVTVTIPPRRTIEVTTA